MNVYRIDARANGTTLDGWESSRQVRTMDVAADGPDDAFSAVSHLVWDMSQTTMYDRYTIGTATALDDQGQPSGRTVYVRVDYRWGSIATKCGGSYSDVKARQFKGSERDR